MAWDAGTTLQFASGVVLAGLAALLLALGFHRPWNRAFALFVAIFGGIRMLLALAGAAGSPAEAAYYLNVMTYLGLADEVALFLFVALFPRRASWIPAPPWSSVPFLAAIAVLGGLYAADHGLFAGFGEGPLGVLDNVFFVTAYAFVPLWLARGALRTPASQARPVLLVSVALACWHLASFAADLTGLLLGGPVLRFGAPVGGATAALLLGVQVALVVSAAALMALLLRAASAAPLPDRRFLLRLSALVGAALATGAGVALHAAAGGRGPYGPLFTVWYLIGSLLVSLALLRYQFLDLDLKIRWTVKQSTIAAAFVGVFFVASEAAQAFFAESAGSQWIGIAAAGALVFAIAPLQRAAERLAEKAVPVVATPAAQPGGSMHEDAYRASVRLALRGGITRREEFDLARIAEAHGLSPLRALEIRDELERAERGAS